MNSPDASAAADTAEYIPYEEFRAGLPAGRFRVIVNPKLARPFVMRRTLSTLVTIAVVGIGIAIALTGEVLIGGLVVAVGVVFSRTVKSQAPKILLHLALRDPAVYREVTSHGLMEVQRSA